MWTVKRPLITNYVGEIIKSKVVTPFFTGVGSTISKNFLVNWITGNVAKNSLEEIAGEIVFK
jgi:hypothetical protein